MRSALATILLAAWVAAPLHAAELGGVTMADEVSVGEQQLVLNGLGLRKKAIFKVYVAGLYLPAKQGDGTKILAEDQPRHLEMEFVRKVTDSQLSGAWDDCLAANSPGASDEVKQGFEQLNGWMETVGSGDRLVFTYQPEAGTTVQVKGNDKGSVQGKDFADALFACWVGETPPSADFKKGLLGL